MRVPGRIAILGTAVLTASATAWMDTPREFPGRSQHETVQPFTLEEATVADLQTALSSGRQTSRSLVDGYLERVAGLDRRGPTLRSVIEINPDASAIADQRDAERKAGRIRGPLHGVPILDKDNIATSDGLQTTAGSLALVGQRARSDAFVIRRLRDAGAIILGKTNMSEWANFRSLHSSSGWSGRGLQTLNPYDLDRSPSGSSSGSAVAVAASLAAVAIGTETDGSIVSPAAVNGVVGLKPTLGLISRSGIIPIAHSQDTAGPLARTVADLAVLLGVLAGTDPDDAATTLADVRGHSDYTQFLNANGLRGARIGVIRESFDASADVATAGRLALDAMRAQGAVLIDPVTVPTFDDIAFDEFDLLLGEFGDDLEQHLRRYQPGGPIRSMADVIRFNEAHRSEELHLFGQELLIEADRRRGRPADRLDNLRAVNRRRAGTDGLDAVLDGQRLDALVAPTEGVAWRIDHAGGDPRTARPGTSRLPAVAGHPHLTVPMGFVNGLPVGLSFIGRAWSEPTLIRIASSFERAVRARRPPTFAAPSRGLDSARPQQQGVPRQR
jgi:amidase